MRIIAGEFRRRRLLASPGLVTRPITDRAKEILFERIQHRLIGRRVADVFAGTGSLGLEALSRGATSVVFIESDRRALELLRRNVEALGVGDRTLCWSADAVNTSFLPKGVDAFLPFDAVFFDPPYRMAAALRPESPLGKSLSRLARDRVTSPEAVLFFRVAEGSPLDLPAAWRPETVIAVASMEIHLYVKAAAEAETAQPEATPTPSSGPDATGGP